MASRFFVEPSDIVEVANVDNNEAVTYGEQLVDEPTINTKDERQAVAELTGTPHPFDAESVKIFKSLLKRQVVADFGDDGWARGANWKFYMRGDER